MLHKGASIMELRVRHRVVYLLLIICDYSILIHCSKIRECMLSHTGVEYRGKMARTQLGYTCQSWNSHSPHPHKYKAGHMFPDGSVEDAKNFCRNPNEEGERPWCYTNQYRLRWDYCDIPSCSGYPECRLTEKGEEYRGHISKTQSALPCEHWDNFNIPKGNSSLDGNHCRNPDGKDRPWCYIKSATKGAWDFCNVPFCKPPMHCIPMSAKYSSFIGTLSVTENGRMCQHWSLQAPHHHSQNVPNKFPDKSVEDAANFCRNPDGDENGVWCYTTDPEVRWEYCDLPRCENECKVTEAGREYNGLQSYTINGFECQRWDSQSPHPHNMTTSDRFPDVNASMAQNYCRNPDGREGGPWCFTNKTDVEWDYCFVPECPTDTDAYPRKPKAKHVLHLGIDGLHPNLMQKATYGIPNIMENLVRRGMSTFTKARTVLTTVSAPGWSTIICGQGVETTGVTSNEWKPVWQHHHATITPVSGASYPFPCVFEAIKAQDNTIRTGFFYNWDWLKYMSNAGIPGSVDYDYYLTAIKTNYGYTDSQLVVNATTYLRNIIKSAERSYTFVYLGNPDVVGHRTTWGSSPYRTAVSYADSQISWLLNVIDEFDMADDFLVMLSTDHGGHHYFHGGQQDSDIRIPMFMRGPGIPANKEFPYTVQTRDMVPTAAYYMGLRQNPWWTGRILREVYQTKKTDNSTDQK